MIDALLGTALDPFEELPRVYRLVSWDIGVHHISLPCRFECLDNCGRDRAKSSIGDGLLCSRDPLVHPASDIFPLRVVLDGDA